MATLDRLAPGRMRARTDAESPQLLVVAEHFDEGWRATLDGGDAKVVRADLPRSRFRSRAGVTSSSWSTGRHTSEPAWCSPAPALGRCWRFTSSGDARAERTAAQRTNPARLNERVGV